MWTVFFVSICNWNFSHKTEDLTNICPIIKMSMSCRSCLRQSRLSVLRNITFLSPTVNKYLSDVSFPFGCSSYELDRLETTSRTQTHERTPSPICLAYWIRQFEVVEATDYTTVTMAWKKERRFFSLFFFFRFFFYPSNQRRLLLLECIYNLQALTSPSI